MTTANEEQAEYWGKSVLGAKWLIHEDQLDHLLAPVLGLVLERAELKPGMRVLDIGCGTGASTIASAQEVGRNGRVLAADFSQPFAHRTRERSLDLGLTQVEVECADAQTFGFSEGTQDAVISRFGVMFFEDPVAAFANMANALKPGGQMTFAAWGPLSDNPWFKLPHIAATNQLGQPPKVDRYAPGPLAFHDIEHVTVILSRAGLCDVRGETVSLFLHGPDTLEETAALCMRVGPASRVISHFGASDEDIEAIRTAVAEAFATFASDDGIRIPAAINLFQARRAA